MKRLFFDIETLANPENCALMPEPVVDAPANYKDPEKITAYVAEKTAAAKAAALEKAALDPDYGKILSIGLYAFSDDPVRFRLFFPRVPENPQPHEAILRECGNWDALGCGSKNARETALATTSSASTCLTSCAARWH